MFIALQKTMAATLAGIFMFAASGVQDASAAPKKHKPQTSRVQKNAPHNRPVNNACVQTASDSFARSQGYGSASTMRRASAIAHVRAERGEDNSIISAIALANRDTGADFDLLVMVSSLESRLGVHDAPLNNSSRARGPFQYLPAPFLTLFNWFAGDYAGGVYSKAAAQITFDELKNPGTGDQGLTDNLLALRSDPYVASYIKGVEVMKDVRPLLRAVLGREPTRTDIYIAHILGLEQDKPLIRALRNSPNAAAADIFPLEASKEDNRSLFYKGNKKLSIRQFYTNLGAKTAAELKRIDNVVKQGLAAKKCLPPLRLERPAPTALHIPDNMPLPVRPALPRPPEDIPFEPDARQQPTPPAEPETTPETIPETTPSTQYPPPLNNPFQTGPGYYGP